MAAKSRTQKSNTDSNFDSLFGIKSGEGFVSGLKTISLERILTGAQPRTIFNHEELQELAGSILALRARGEGVDGTGILQPILVTREGDNYKLIAGERRLRASKIAGLTELPALEVSSREDTLLAVQLIENLQRSELNPLDEAHALKKLTSEQKLSIRDLATLVGKTRGYVTNRLDLLKMGEDVQGMVSQRQDTLRTAVHINHIEDSKQRAALIQAVIEEGIGEREVKRRIEAGRTGINPAITTSRKLVSSREDTNQIDKDRSEVTIIVAEMKKIMNSINAAYGELKTKRNIVLNKQEREEYIQLLKQVEKDIEHLRKKI